MMIDINRMPYRYWDDDVKISYLQRRVIVYSILYYEMNESCISDKEYDELSKQLVHLQRSVDKGVLEKTQYYYVMHDFDGTTGFDIYDRLNEHDKEYLMTVSKFVLDSYRRETKRKW